MALLIALTLLFAPAYAVKLNFFGLPFNFLLWWVFLVWIFFSIYLAIKNQWKDFIAFKLSLNKKLLVFTFLFFVSGLISLFWQGFSLAKLGQFIALFVQPISLFIIAGFIWQQNPDSKNLFLTACYLLLALMGIFSIVQYFTLFSLPPEYWGNSVEPKRALAFFSHPNFYALFSAPLLVLLIPDIAKSIKYKVLSIKYLKVASWTLGAIGLLLSLSRAGWLGLGAATFVFLFTAADKKIRKLAGVIIIIIVMIILAVPNLHWRFVLPFYGEKSAVSRLSLWQTGGEAIKESPILGSGLKGFSNNWERLNTDPNLDSHNFPHNIFLNFWVETGLAGLISIIGLISLMIISGLRYRNDAYRLGVALFLVAILFQGLIDNPYFKNDLAMVFWLALSLAI